MQPLNAEGKQWKKNTNLLYLALIFLTLKTWFQPLLNLKTPIYCNRNKHFETPFFNFIVTHDP